MIGCLISRLFLENILVSKKKKKSVAVDVLIANIVRCTRKDPSSLIRKVYIITL